MTPAGWSSRPPTPLGTGGPRRQRAGFYYEIKKPDVAVQVPFWLVTALAAFPPALRLRRRLVVRRRGRHGLCPDCGYDLRASTARCPECGRPIDQARRS